jgi:hypothetical protein
MADFIARYWLEVLFSLVFAGFGGVIKHIFTQFKAVKLGMQAMLRNSIIDKYNHYTEQGFIPIYGLENVTSMYDQYHELGGNGTITRLYNELKELPTRKEDD